MNITFLNFVLLALASFRLTRLIVFDKITEFLRSPFFDEIEEANEEGVIEVYYMPKEKGVKRFLGELLSCYWCTGVWVSALIVLWFDVYPSYASPFVLILAVAGLGAIVESLIQRVLGK